MTKLIQESSDAGAIGYQAFLAGDLQRRPPAVSVGGAFELKICADNAIVVTGNGQLTMMVPLDLDGMSLLEVAAGVSTEDTGGDPTVVMIRNATTAQDMLSTPITIDTSEPTSYTASTPPVIDPAQISVFAGDMIAIDVDGAGDAMGLMVVLVFGPPIAVITS